MGGWAMACGAGGGGIRKVGRKNERERCSLQQREDTSQERVTGKEVAGIRASLRRGPGAWMTLSLPCESLQIFLVVLMLPKQNPEKFSV